MKKIGLKKIDPIIIQQRKEIRELKKNDVNTIISHIKSQQSEMDVIFSYIGDNCSCQDMWGIPSNKLMKSLNLDPIKRNTYVIALLEKYFNSQKK